jgi:hypothetical protein
MSETQNIGHAEPRSRGIPAFPCVPTLLAEAEAGPSPRLRALGRRSTKGAKSAPREQRLLAPEPPPTRGGIRHAHRF